MEKAKDYATMILFGAFLVLGYHDINRPSPPLVPDGYILMSKSDLRKINSGIEKMRANHDICFIYNKIRSNHGKKRKK